MEKNSFEDVYVSYEKPVYNYVLRMVKDGSLAEDITQDVFVKVYQNLANFRGDAKLSTWIYQIATNTYLDYFRSAAHKKESMTDHLDDDGMGTQREERIGLV
ncbi:MAG: sigma-70 family RNA polymerase sigma factor [bacterium]